MAFWKPKFPSRKSIALIGGLVLAAAILSLASVLSERQARLDRAESELSDALLAFSRAAGFGGFIHDFKNYILRPSELRYRIEAAQEIDIMEQQIARIEAIARSRGSEYDLDAVRDATAAFRRALETVDDLNGTGMSARQIDAQVRIEERPASQEIDRIADDIRQLLAAANRRAEQQRSILGTLFAFLVLFAYAALGARLKRARQREANSDRATG